MQSLLFSGSREIYESSGYTIADTMICAGTTGKGPCHGDSGGPLVDEKGLLIGIVSWGNGCARGYPGVFTKVSYFLDWINQSMSTLRTSRKAGVHAYAFVKYALCLF